MTKPCLLPLDPGLVMMWIAGQGLSEPTDPRATWAAAVLSKYFQNLARVLSATVIRMCFTVTRVMMKFVDKDVNLQLYLCLALGDTQIITSIGME